MMTDEEFRQKCREISYANIEDYMEGASERQYLVSTRKENVDILKTAALLYIAASMPNSNDEENKPEVNQDKCPYCAGGEVTLTSFESEAIEDSYITLLFDPEDGTLTVRDDASHVEGCVDISNCPMCGRAL